MTKDIVANFVSLGDNCEFGLFQRHHGYEPLSVFSFARSHLEGVARALEDRFRYLSDPDQLTVVESLVDPEKPEYMLKQKLYLFSQHSGVPPSSMSIDIFRERELEKLEFLAGELLEQARQASKIFVIKQNAGIAPATVDRISDALSELGSAPLLMVKVTADPSLVGTATRINDRLLIGHIDRFAPYEAAYDFSEEYWSSILRHTLELIDKKAVPATPKRRSRRGSVQTIRQSATDIYKAYRQVLRRDPDKGAYTTFAGFNQQDLLIELAQSLEFSQQHPDLSRCLSVDQIVRYTSLCNEKVLGSNGGLAEILHPEVVRAIDKNFDKFLSDVDGRRIIVGLTSLGRKSLYLTLDSIYAQRRSDGSLLKVEVIVNMPLSVSEDKILELTDRYPKLIVRRTADWGPITKLTETLRAIDDPQAIIILADDDVLYPEQHFTTICSTFIALDERFAIAASGFNWNGQLRRSGDPNFVPGSYWPVEGHLSEIQVMETWCGVALRRDWFSQQFLELAEYRAITTPEMMRTDDGFYSTYLDTKGIAKLNINSTYANRYDSGFDSYSSSLIAQHNIEDDPLNGIGSISMQWVRYAEYCIEMQKDIFIHCAERRPESAKILFLTMSVGDDYTRKVLPGLTSKIAYCNRYGYAYRNIDHSLDESLPLIWSKIIAIRDALSEGFEYVFYTDADVVITNPAIRFESIIDKMRSDVAYTYDINGINIGTLLVRNTVDARALIDAVLAMDGFHHRSPWYEQAAFIVVLRDEPKFREVTEGMPQRVFNSYLYCWHHNDFLVHFAGIYGSALADAMAAVYQVVYNDNRIRNSTFNILRPFFFEYKPDPNSEEYLKPAKLKGEDVYMKINNKRTDKKTLILFLSTSELLTSLFKRLLLATEQVAFLPAWLPNRPQSGQAWADTIIEGLQDWEASKPYIAADMSGYSSHVSDYWNTFAGRYNVQYIGLLNDGDISTDIPTPVQDAINDGMPHDHAITIRLSSFISEPELQLRRLSVFLGFESLEEVLVNRVMPNLQGKPEELNVFSALRLLQVRSGCSVLRERPFSKLRAFNVGGMTEY